MSQVQEKNRNSSNSELPSGKIEPLQSKASNIEPAHLTLKSQITIQKAEEMIPNPFEDIENLEIENYSNLKELNTASKAKKNLNKQNFSFAKDLEQSPHQELNSQSQGNDLHSRNITQEDNAGISNAFENKIINVVEDFFYGMANALRTGPKSPEITSKLMNLSLDISQNITNTFITGSYIWIKI